jgi:predicted metal-dependent phosphotriesterase family hydrolase
MLRNIRHCGVGASFLSSDLGQQTAPPVEHGLAHFADRLLAEGFSEDEIRTMAVDNTRRLIKHGS